MPEITSAIIDAIGGDPTARATLAASVRSSDGTLAAFDADLRAGIYYTGKIDVTLEPALAAVSGVYTRASDALRFNADRLLETAAQNAPTQFYEFSPSLAGRGVLFERASLNQLPNTGAVWGTLSNATQVSSPANGPDGKLSMFRATTTAAGGYVQQSGLVLPGDTSRWTGSVMVAKTAVSAPVAFTVVLVSGGGATGQVSTASLDTLTGAVTTANGAPVEVGVVDRGNFWLLWVSSTLSNNTSAQLRFYPGGLTGSGTADYGWGQMEPGYTPTSRIKTTGTAGVRRERDTLTIPVPSLAAAGTVEVTATPPTGATTRVLAQIDDGTDNNRVTVQRSDAGVIQAVWVSAGNIVATMDLGAHVAGTSTKVAIGWGAGTLKAIRNGVAVVVAAAVPSNLKALRLGGRVATTSLDGPVSRVTTWAGLRTDIFYEEPTNVIRSAGDSMSNGAGASGDDRWWQQLGKDLGRPFGTIGVGGSTSSEMLVRCSQQTTGLSSTYLYWTGHNVPNAIQTVADLKSAIALQSPDPRKRRFLIGLPVQSKGNAVGSAGYNEILATRALIKATWPDNYVDIPAILEAAALALGDTAQSDPNIANGYTPTRFLADDIHHNAAAQSVANRQGWQPALLAKGW